MSSARGPYSDASGAQYHPQQSMGYQGPQQQAHQRNDYYPEDEHINSNASQPQRYDNRASVPMNGTGGASTAQPHLSRSRSGGGEANTNTTVNSRRNGGGRLSISGGSKDDFVAGPPYGSQPQASYDNNSRRSHHHTGSNSNVGSMTTRGPNGAADRNSMAAAEYNQQQQQQQQQQQHNSQQMGTLSSSSRSNTTPRNYSPAPASPALSNSNSTLNRDFAPGPTNNNNLPPPVGASNSSMGPPTMSNNNTTASRRNSQLGGPISGSRSGTPSTTQAPITTIAGEPLHDMDRAIGLLRSSKFYAEGFLMKRVEVGPDGKSHQGHAEAQWAKWFVQLSGTIMSTWNAAEMEQAARQNRTVPPQYLNLADVFVHPFPPAPTGPPTPTQFQFALNSAGLNRVLFCAPNEGSLLMWINAIRLAAWERSRCNEIYTGTLLGLREPKPTGWIGFDAGLTPPGSAANATGGRFEGFLKARLPGDTEWRKTWTVLIRSKNLETGSLKGSIGPGGNGSTKKKDRRTSILGGLVGKKHVDLTDIDDLPGDGIFSTMAFYANKPTKKEAPLCIAQHVFYASAIYPESEKLIDRSGLFKIEGTFLNPNDGYRTGWGVGGRAERQGYALLMVEEGASAAMLQWIVGISDVFKLYGRPRSFSFDPRDPSSLYFALPIGPHRDRQFLDRELVDTLDINESRPRAVRAVFHNILFDRMRGVRPTALPPIQPPSSSRSSSTAPQLAPVTNTPSIREENEDEEDRRRNAEYGIGSGIESSSNARSNARDPSTFHHSPETNAPAANYATFNSTDRSGNSSPPLPPITTTTNTGSRPALPPIVTSAPSRSGQQQQQLHQQSNQQSSSAMPNYSRPIPNATPSAQPQHHTSPREDMYEHNDPQRTNDALGVAPILTSGASDVSSVGPLPYLTDRSHKDAQVEQIAPQREVHQEEQGRQTIQGPASALGMDRPSPAAAPPAPAPAPVATPPIASSSPPIPSKSPERQFRQLSPPLPSVSDSFGNHSTSAAPIADVKNQTSYDTSAAGVENHHRDIESARSVNASATSPVASSDIHSDLLAALHFVDRSESPPPISVAATPSTMHDHGSPAEAAQPWHVGPPRRASHSMFDAGSPPIDHRDLSRFAEGPKASEVEALKATPEEDIEETTPPALSTVNSNYAESPAAAAPSVAAAPSTSFPSSFAPNKRAEDRAAAALLAQQAQQAQQAAKSRPGRPTIPPSISTTSNSRKPRAWVDSDEDEDEPDEDEEEDSDDEVAARQKRMQTSISQPSLLPTRDSQPIGINRLSSQGDINHLATPEQNRPHMSSSPSRGSFDVLREPSPQPVGQGLKPAVSPHGLLHAGIIDKEERSAKALEMAARDTGGPLVSIPSKPPPPQTGLVGAITSLEREKERTGGVGKALTEQQKERKLAEQRQRQLDDMQRHQLAQQQYQMQAQYQQMQMMQAYGGMPPYGAAPAPWMMGGGGFPGPYGSMLPPASAGGSQIGGMTSYPSMTMSSPSVQAGSPVMAPVGANSGAATSPAGPEHQYQQQQQHHFLAAQQAAQAAAQAAYAAAMAQFAAPPQSGAASPGSSPALPASMASQYSPFPAAVGYGAPSSPPMGYGGMYNPYAGAFPGQQSSMMMSPPTAQQQPLANHHQQQQQQQQPALGQTGGDDNASREHFQDRSMSPMRLPQ